MATSIQEAQRATNAAKPFLGKEGIIQTLKDKRKEFSNLGTVEINYDNFKEHLSAFENA
jgi:hypothetical protein